MYDETNDEESHLLDYFGKALYRQSLENNPALAERAASLLDMLTEDQRAALQTVAACSKIALSKHDPDMLVPAIQCLIITGFFGSEEEDEDVLVNRAVRYAEKLWQILEATMEMAEQDIVKGAEALLERD